jgi:hypothetical protein
MSTLIAMACLALLGTTRHAWTARTATSADPHSTPTTTPAACRIQQAKVTAARSLSTAASAAHTYTTFGIRYATTL